MHRLLGLFDSSRCFKAKNLSLIKSRRYLKYFVTVADENCLFKENTKLRYVLIRQLRFGFLLDDRYVSVCFF